MCYYEEECWPSRYHDYIPPDYIPPQPKPKTAELTFEEIVRRLENLPKDSNRFSGFKF